MLAGSAALVISCAGSSSTRYGDRIDVSSYPQHVRAAYSVFAVRCSRCHTLARPLNAKIRDPEHWVRYVTRMRRNPGSGINQKDADTILQFLLYYTQQLVAEQDAQSGTDQPQPSLSRSPLQAGEAEPSEAESGAVALPRTYQPQAPLAQPVTEPGDRRNP